MKRRCGLLALSLWLLLAGTGCWDFNEVEHVIYINAIGVDYVDRKYILYAQVIDFSAISKQETSSGRKEEKIALGKGVGDTFDQAAFDLYKSSQQRTSWAHISALVFTERAIREGVQEHAVDLLSRYHEMRHTMWTFGTQEPLEDLLVTKTILSISSFYSRLNDPIDPYRQNSTIQPLTLQQVLTSMREPASTTVFPYLGVDKSSWNSNKKKQDMFTLSGVGLVINGRYKGYLDRQQLKGLRWLQPKVRRVPVFTYADGKPLAAVIFLRPKVQVTTSMVGNEPVFDIKIKAKGKVLEYSQSRSDSFIQQIAAKEIESEVRKTYQAGLNLDADVLDLGLELYRSNPDVWHRLQKKGDVPLRASSLRSVQVDLRLESSGKLKPKTE